MIGDLKHRLTLQSSVSAPDGGGGFTEAWQDVAASPNVYAAISPLSGGEQLRFHQLSSAVTHHIVIRHRDDVTPRHRLVSGNTVYNILSALDRSGEKLWLDILAEIKMP